MLRCRSILVLLLIDGLLLPQQGTVFLVETKSTNSNSLYHYISYGVFRHGNAWSDILHQFLFCFLFRPFPTRPSGGMCWLSSLHRDLPVLLIQHSGLSLQFSTFHFRAHPCASLPATSTVFSCWLLSPLKSHALKYVKDHSWDVKRKIH